MSFKLSCDITIGTFNFTTVHDVRVKRSMRNLMDTAQITLPQYGYVTRGKSASRNLVNIRELINDGDYVLIKLGYNGQLQTEFEGFVYRRGLGNPMVVECEGYSWQLRNKVDVTKYYPETKASTLLALTAANTNVTTRVADDLPLVKMRLTHVNGVQIAEEIKKISQGVLNVFFISPRELWCGLTYTPYSQGTDPLGLGTANYRLGYNCVRNNRLKQRTVNEPVQVIYSGMYATGKRIYTASEAQTAKRKEKAVINNIPDEPTIKKIANEKQYRANYTGLEGSITGFLQPFCWPGWRVNLADKRNPEQNGVYLVESTEVLFGMSGGRRIVELGPRIGFKPE